MLFVLIFTAGVVGAAGCSKEKNSDTNGLERNREDAVAETEYPTKGKPDAQARIAADTGAIESDAGNVKSLESSAQDAPSFDSDEASTRRCGALRPWIAPEGVYSPVVIRGADGFAAIRHENADLSDNSVYLYDAAGNEIFSVYQNYPSHVIPASQVYTDGLAKATASGDLIVIGMVVLPLRQTQVTAVLINNGSRSSIGIYGRDSLFEYGSGLGSFERLGDHDDSLSTVALDDTIVLGTSGRVYTSQPVDGVSIGESSSVLGLARLDLSGRIIAGKNINMNSGYPFDAWKLATDEENRSVVLGGYIEGNSTSSIYTAKVSSRVLLFDYDFSLMGIWTAPEDIRVFAIEPDGQGRVLAAGRRGGGEMGRVWLQLLSYDGFSTFTQIWSEARFDTGGTAVAVEVAPSGDFVVAGIDQTADGSYYLWLQRYDDNGVPLCSPRAQTEPTMTPHLFVDVSLQSDGAVFLSSFGAESFIYTE
ncbi:MAG: hypothetical protein JXA30_06030 [Deltaproteobacteria bacterium]|nr:hypothetical protein [Deltaproteobacteria bacterium]